MRTREDGTRQVANSEMRAFIECRRRWWLAYYRGLRRSRGEETTGAAAIGTRVHIALAAYYRADPKDALDAMWTAFDFSVQRDMEVTPEDGHKQLLNEIDLARAMLEGYVEWLAETGADSGLKVVGVEEAVEAPSPVPGVNLVAKLDVRVEREDDGTRLFLDHKTVAEFTTPKKTLHMDQQMLTYHLLERIIGVDRPTGGALYNMLRKVKRTGRAKPPFYERVEVHHSDEELRSFYQRVWGVVTEIVKLEERLAAGEDPRAVAYPTPTRDCTWKCEFFPVCPMVDDASDLEGVLASAYEVGEPYERYGSDLDEKGSE